DLSGEGSERGEQVLPRRDAREQVDRGVRYPAGNLVADALEGARPGLDNALRLVLLVLRDLIELVLNVGDDKLRGPCQPLFEQLPLGDDGVDHIWDDRMADEAVRDPFPRLEHVVQRGLNTPEN